MGNQQSAGNGPQIDAEAINRLVAQLQGAIGPPQGGGTPVPPPAHVPAGHVPPPGGLHVPPPGGLPPPVFPPAAPVPAPTAGPVMPAPTEMPPGNFTEDASASSGAVQYLRVCRFCGAQAYWRSGICLNERCRVTWLQLFFLFVHVRALKTPRLSN